jgi:hypothetical protein
LHYIARKSTPPSYDLVCTTLDEVDGGALAFDDPNRQIHVALIHLREDQRHEVPPTDPFATP